MRLGILAALLAIVAGIAYWTVVRQREQARWVTGYQEASDSYERMHYADAEAQLRMLLPEANKPDNHRSALTMNLLALVYHAEGRRKEAEPLFEKAIHIFEKEGSTSLMDLAKACNNEGEFIWKRTGAGSRTEITAGSGHFPERACGCWCGTRQRIAEFGVGA